jgi:hypothetical protein
LARQEGCAHKAPDPPRHEVAGIFRAHGDAYRLHHALTPVQRKVMWAITACRTPVLGGHVDVCPHCGHKRPALRSCCNRHCPKCQALAQHKWLQERMRRILPVHYFHVVLTVPHQLCLLALHNPKLVYDLLFRTAADTLLQLGLDPKWLGAQLGMTAVLHTWARNLILHPHIHFIVTGGGLSLDGLRWVPANRTLLFPNQVIAALFRGKLLAALAQAHKEGKLDLPEELAAPDAFAELCSCLYAKNWVVDTRHSFAGPDRVFAYLGQYTHRVAISNHRLLDVTDQAVTIATRGGKTAKLGPLEFIHRFLLHVLPDGFVKIRHYGLMASGNVKTRLEDARRLLAPQTEPDDDAGADKDEQAEDWRSTFERLTGIDLTICPACGGRMVRYLVEPAPRPAFTPARSPP